MTDQFGRYARRRPAGTHRWEKRRILKWTLVILICLAAAAFFVLLKTCVISDNAQEMPYGMSSGAEETRTVKSAAAQEQAASGNLHQALDSTDWMLVLVNRWHPLDEKYEVELTALSGGQYVDSRIYDYLQAMLDAARADGVYPVVVAGYRTAEKQQSLMDEKIAELMAGGYSETDAKNEAEKWVAIPGTSEHQLGLAVDINADGIRSAGYEVYDWLAENAHAYGFICRYPDDKTDVTGVYNEPWHYRYVGAEAAAEMFERNLCLEEYLEHMKGKDTGT